MATNPTDPIQPVNLPSAAGIDYGEGDVRHFGQGDDVSVPGISNPTRHLAQRDNLLAEKLNDVIENVNNREQFVPLPVVRTIVAPVDESVVLNYRIPAGFESRVLNAIITSTPSSTDLELDIYYNAGFGGTSGTAIVTTASEFSGGVTFYQQGEFIVALKNKSGTTLEIAASVLLTLRPIGAAGTLLVGSTIKGDKGDPGMVGPPGPPGAPGSGSTGNSAMRWSGSWAYLASYAVGDVVRFDLLGVGTQASSFIALSAHTADASNSPQGYAVAANPWDLVALGGTPGAAGATGSTGSSGTAATFLGQTTSVNGTFTAGTPFVGTAQEYGAYAYNFGNSTVAIEDPGDVGWFTMQQTDFGQATGTPKGIVHLAGAIRHTFAGWGTIELPSGVSVLGGATTVNYNNSDIKLTVCSNGTIQPETVISDGTSIPEVISYPHPTTSNKYVLAALGTKPIQVEVVINGLQIIV